VLVGDHAEGPVPGSPRRRTLWRTRSADTPCSAPISASVTPASHRARFHDYVVPASPTGHAVVPSCPPSGRKAATLLRVAPSRFFSCGPGMVKRQCPDRRYHFAAPLDAAEPRCPDCASFGGPPRWSPPPQFDRGRQLTPLLVDGSQQPHPRAFPSDFTGRGRGEVRTRPPKNSTALRGAGNPPPTRVVAACRHTRRLVVEAPFCSPLGGYVEDNPVDRMEKRACQASSVRSVVYRNWTALQTASVDIPF
jgi:hypothetical protein